MMLYAWCRHADDVVDGQVLGSTPEAGGDPAARLMTLKAQTLDALHGKGAISAPFAALRHDMPDRWPLDLIDGFAMDVAGRQYRTICRIGSPLIASTFRTGI